MPIWHNKTLHPSRQDLPGLSPRGMSLRSILHPPLRKLNAHDRPGELGRYPTSMYVPTEITERVETLSARLGCKLVVVQCWKNEFREGMYCRFRGLLHDSSILKLELAGTLCVELTPEHEDSIDLFLFANGVRLGPYRFDRNESHKYLVGKLLGNLRWEYDDEGFDQFETLDDTFGNRGIVHESLAIHPPKTDR